jgi:urease alpha subunit
MFDIILKNGKIIDGSGNCWFAGDLGILEGKVKKIGKMVNGKLVISEGTHIGATPGRLLKAA